MEKESYIYILTNYEQTTLYIGVTNNLVRRTFIHREKFNKVFSDITQAIAREKQLKGGSRQKKLDLITKFNPSWDDLYEMIIS